MTLEAIRKRFEKELAQLYTQKEARQHFSDLCLHFFGYQPATVVIHLKKTIEKSNAVRLLDALDKLVQNVPIQYIIGHVLFGQTTIHVNSAVLIPRPETEELVHYILEGNTTGKPFRVLDVGTGSGCIAIALKKARPNWKVTAWDIDGEALEVAKENAVRNNVSVDFEQIDIFSNSRPKGIWDIIVSNPPYVPESLKSSTAPHVLLQEPLHAIFVANKTPLIFYESIATYAQKYLVSGGRLFFEGHNPLMKSLKIFLEQQGFCDIVLRNDFRGTPRFIDAINA
jgi:release factor glutamine methyltransferase